MDLTMRIVNNYTAMRNMDVAQSVEISSMKRCMDAFEQEAQALIDAISIVTSTHVDVSV